MKQLLKTNSKKVLIVILFTIVTVVAIISALNQNDLKIQEPDTTQQTQYADVDVTEPTDEVEQSTEETSSEVVDEFEPELTEEASSNSKEEPTTKKEPVTKKPTPVKKTETTTKKPVETTTKKPSSPTFNGHKPYEVFADETGTQYYYTESGRLCCAETLTTKPAGNYDGSYCRSCGSEDCIRAMSSYYCVTCEKSVSASTCHPKSHYNASH